MRRKSTRRLTTRHCLTASRQTTSNRNETCLKGNKNVQSRDQRRIENPPHCEDPRLGGSRYATGRGGEIQNDVLVRPGHMVRPGYGRGTEHICHGQLCQRVGRHCIRLCGWIARIGGGVGGREFPAPLFVLPKLQN